MVIHVADFVPACDNVQQGDVLRVAILRALINTAAVSVSFAGLTSATSSFVNAAFVDLLHDMSFDDIKERVRITNSTRQINDMIRTRLTREAERSVAA
jgi:hypothetical protein